MTKLILGTVQFGLTYGVNNTIGCPAFDDVCKILNYAAANGITELDTADVYGNSQEVLRKYFNESKCSFKLMSKFIWNRNEDFNFHLNHTFSVLNQSEIYGYYFHRFEDFKNFKYFDQIEIAKKNKKLRYLGVSLYTIEELEFAINHPHVELIQLPFNLLDRDLRKQQLLKTASQKGILIYIRSVFLQGLFFRDVSNLPPSLVSLREPLIELSNIAKENNLTMESLALSYVKSKNFIDGVLIGVDSVHQLESNLHSFQEELSPLIIEKIENITIDNFELLNPANWKL